MNYFLNYCDRSIKRLVMSSFIFVLMVPIAFFLYSLQGNSWDNVKEGILEKHKLIATSMIEPFTLFITSKQQALQATGDNIYELVHEAETSSNSDKTRLSLKKELDSFLRSYDDLVAISYQSLPGMAHYQQISSRKIVASEIIKPNYQTIPLNKIPTFEGDESSIDLLSSVFKSSISKAPVILLKHYVTNVEGIKIGVLYAEYSLDHIGSICSGISFGVKGHCAIVDRTGHVLAHPNKGWVKEIRNISKISVVKMMMKGQSGTTVFYSPFMKADMVAGFTSVPLSGWGVMVPQPKNELTHSLESITNNTIIWLTLGILIALMIAYMLAHRITQPISHLVKRTNEIDTGYEYINLGNLPSNSPIEIRQLWNSISLLLSGLQASNKEVKKLNVNLSREVHKATKELKETNRHLFEISSKDYLTGLANRRFFTQKMDEVLSKNTGKESIGIIMIDVDKFKFINDQYGHEAGDLALQHIAKILTKLTRKCDLVARLGGDEFVIYIKNNTASTLAMIAKQLGEAVEESPLKVDGQLIELTLSIGTVNYHNDDSIKLEKLLGYADSAMYVSKEAGRNQASAYSFTDEKSNSEVA